MSVNLDIRTLTAEQRLALIGDIWDSLAPAEIPLSKAQREELDRRLDDLGADPHPGIPWDEVLRQIRDRSR
jgi:putative addiction module component (TIGR02574 family)